MNAVFFRRLYQLLKIGIPGVLSSEFGYVVLIAAALVGRTLCDLWLIKKGTLIETYVVFLINNVENSYLTNSKYCTLLDQLLTRMDHCSRDIC